MKRNPLYVIIVLAAILFSACENEKDKPEPVVDPVESPAFTKEGELSLFKPYGELIQKIDIEVADELYEWETGLMHRKSMEENQGMLFIYGDAQNRSFYMKNTYIPLDILYFGGDSTLVSFVENAKPLDETPLPSEKPAQFVLEINAGLIQDWSIELGDRIRFELLNKN